MPKLHKYNWSCRCTPNQHKRAPAPAPACENCGRLMFTDDFICDPGAAKPPPIVEVKAGETPPTRNGNLDVLLAQRVSQHDARITKLESRQKTATTVIAELDAVLPRMSADELGKLVAVIDKHIGQWSVVRARAVELAATPRPIKDPGEEN